MHEWLVHGSPGDWRLKEACFVRGRFSATGLRDLEGVPSLTEAHRAVTTQETGLKHSSPGWTKEEQSIRLRGYTSHPKNTRQKRFSAQWTKHE